MKRRKKKSMGLYQGCILLILLLVCVTMVYPFVYIFSASLTEGHTYFTEGILLFAKDLTMENYAAVLEMKNIWQSTVISVSRTIFGTVLSVLLMAMLAYALCDKELPGRSFFVKYFFLTTILNGGMIPYVIVLQNMNLMNSYWVYIIPAIYSFYNMIIIRTNFESIPISIVEAAKLDGVGELRMFFKIYMPLAKPGLVVVAMYTAIFHWNDWFAGAYYVTNAKMKPLATVLQELVMNSGAGTASSAIADSTTIMAFTVLMILPIVLVYPFLQKYFVDGVAIGSIKE